MRSRINQIPYSIPAGSYEQDQYWIPTGAFVRTAGQDTSPVLPFGFQVDELIVDEEPRMKRYGACTHTVTKTKYYENAPSIKWEWFPDRFVNKYSGGYWLYSVRGVVATWLNAAVTTRVVDRADMSYEALSAMRPSFSDASLLNDLLEFRQIAALINPLGLKKDFAKRFRQGKFRGQDNLPYISSRTKGLANVHLWHQFGVKPAIASLKEVVRLIKELPRAIANLRAKSSQTITRHYSRKMDFMTLPTPGVTVYTGSGYVVKQTTQWITPPVYHASMRFRYDVSRLTDLELTVRAWAQALGLDKPLRVAWNAIPLSFVVDWFVDIGRWLGSLTDGTVIPIVVEDFCSSTKFRYSTSATATLTVGIVEPKTVTTLNVGTRTHGVYDRAVGPPSTTSRLRFGLPSVDQVFTLVALGTQRISPRKPLKKPPLARWLKFSSNTVVRNR